MVGRSAHFPSLVGAILPPRSVNTQRGPSMFLTLGREKREGPLEKIIDFIEKLHRNPRVAVHLPFVYLHILGSHNTLS